MVPVEEVSMLSHILVDATDLEVWSNRRDAQGLLPQIVRRLILVTVDRVLRIDFPAKEGVQLGGWDGFAAVEQGNEFVSYGVSAWELSTRRDVKGKADEDYEKRSTNPLGLNPAEATFVFVTPRRWRGKGGWAASKNNDGIWREVRAYDADDLATWLELAPSVHIWLSSIIGKYVENVIDLQTFWTDWSEATAPSINADLVISGRQEETDNVHSWLRGEPSALSLRAESREEALAFFAASLEQLSLDERQAYFARGIVVKDIAAWQPLIVSDSPLLLIPMFDSGDAVAKGVRSGHHVLIPLGNDASPLSAGVQLSRLKRDSAKEALVQMGLSDKRADDLATLTRRSLTALRRKLAISPALQCPDWAESDEARVILPALLAGTWNDASEGDREVVSTLADIPYEDVSNNLLRWANESDPPVRLVGSTWVLVSKEDSWSLLRRFITRRHRQNFKQVVLDVLGTPDPRFELPSNKRWVAGLSGRTLPHSGLLREGLADTLALIGARSEATRFADGSSGQRFANRIVRLLVQNANQDWRVWASISPVLPLLAEAAPEAFLNAVDEGLSGEQPVLLNLFSDSDQSSAMFDSSPHTGLLWALETLAWGADYLGRASILLAKLARVDPGGQLANRPQKSLQEIFCTWFPQTSADLDQRLHVLDAIRRRESDVAWCLLGHLLPSHLLIATPTHSPRWREWVPDPKPRISYAEVDRAVNEISMRLLDDVGTDGQRWQDLTEQINLLPKPQQDIFIEKLWDVDVEAFEPTERVTIWEALRKLVASHRRHSNADWALPTEQVNNLEHAYQRFEPSDILSKHRWLFSDGAVWSDFEGDDLRSQTNALEDTRIDVVTTIYDQGGLPYLLEFADKVERPYELGVSIGRSELLTEEEEENAFLRDELNTPEIRPGQLACGFIVSRYYIRGREWACEKLSNEAAANWSTEQRARFLICLPFGGIVWDLVESTDMETQNLYWRRINPGYLRGPNEFERGAANLLEHGRPYAAINLIALCVNSGRQPRPAPDLTATALESALQTHPGEDIDLGPFTSSVAELLDYLESSGMIEESRLAALEWGFLPLFMFKERESRILHRELARNPEFFSDIVNLVYSAEDEDEPDLSEEDHKRARLGDRLLDTWRRIPGLTEDGSVNPEALEAWVSRAREITSERGRGSSGDYVIGRVLSCGATDPDGTWPSVAVRNVIEEVASEAIERGFRVSVYDRRGVFSKSVTEGGRQERQLAAKYAEYASMISGEWPRTAAMLRKIANTYAEQALEEDLEAELRQDLWR
jgi:hypothetical protein